MKHCLNFTAIAKLARHFRLIAVFRLFLAGFFLMASQFAEAQSKYVKKYRPMADSLSGVYGVPVSIMLGIAIMESGSGTSRNCKLLNNHFGIVGKNNLLKTKGVKSRYKQYPHAQASYVDFCKLMAKKRFYKTLKDNSDYKLWADSISKAGYSEIPDIWKQRLIAIIQKNKLSALD